MAQTLKDAKITPLLVNFGGPRYLDEIFPFLKELLCDRDVVWTNLPSIIHRFLFSTIAYRRAKKIRTDYELIGGKSPIYFDTEKLAEKLSEKLQTRILTFHRYLPKTHANSLKEIENCATEQIRILPLFPQFTFATSGSIARFFSDTLSKRTVQKLRWIPSYPDHPLYINAFQQKIRGFLNEKNLREEETLLLFSAHGVPKTFIETGDPYQAECERTFQGILKTFPKVLGKLCYQSKFGKGEWIQPYTNEVCEGITKINQGRQNIVFIPLSFTSDHIETLFEVDYQYLPLIQKNNLNAYRCPALNLEPNWIDALSSLFLETSLFFRSNHELINLKKV